MLPQVNSRMYRILFEKRAFRLELLSTFKTTGQYACETSQLTLTKNLWRRKAPCKPTQRCLEFYLKRELLRLLRLLMTGAVDNRSQQ